jgi:hypothetical protein
LRKPAPTSHRDSLVVEVRWSWWLRKPAPTSHEDSLVIKVVRVAVVVEESRTNESS